MGDTGKAEQEACLKASNWSLTERTERELLPDVDCIWTTVLEGVTRTDCGTLGAEGDGLGLPTAQLGTGRARLTTVEEAGSRQGAVSGAGPCKLGRSTPMALRIYRAMVTC